MDERHTNGVAFVRARAIRACVHTNGKPAWILIHSIHSIRAYLALTRARARDLAPEIRRLQMTAEAATLTRSWKVGRFTVTLTVPPLHKGGFQSAAMEWEPHLPKHLSQEEFDAYVAGRNAAVLELAQELGINALVIEV